MIIFDTETTGLLLPSVEPADKQPRIIDLALVQIDHETGAEVHRFETLINPGVPLSAEITKITGYKDEDLVGAPTFAEVYPYLCEFVLGESAWLAHNLPFDRGMLYWELARLDLVTAFPWPFVHLDTVQIGIEQYGGQRLHLTQMYKKVTGRDLDQKHTAMADVEALLEVVRGLRLYELAILPT